MSSPRLPHVLVFACALVATAAHAQKKPNGDDETLRYSRQMIEQGRQIFRYDTFGDEAFWGDGLQLHKAIAGEKNGGVGGGVSPKTALSVGLKVDATAIPASVAKAIKAGKVDLDDPAVTVTLLKLNAVVGVKGIFDEGGKLTGMGITCALCHSTVDDSFAPGIGKRRDGWPNRDLNSGAIIALAPNLQPVADYLGVGVEDLKKVLNGWGPGKFDAGVFLDGKPADAKGKLGATLIPSAFGLAGVNLGTYGGWGSITYWNAMVANLEMHGQGVFFDQRMDDPKRYPLAAKNKLGATRAKADHVTAKLPALHYYQLSLPTPTPPKGSYDVAAAARGQTLFTSKANCASCHVLPLMTEPGHNMHAPSDVGLDDFLASRSPEGKIRTTPLKGLFTKTRGGFYHDGRFANLDAVVDHYDTLKKLGLSPAEKKDLVEYLKSL